MDEIGFCPFGSECVSIVDNKIHRCNLHTKMSGTDAEGKNHDEWRCALAWMPLLSLDQSRSSRGQTAAIESMRNEQTKRQDVAIKHLQEANNAKIAIDR